MENVDGEKHKLLTIIYKREDANKRICERRVFTLDWESSAPAGPFRRTFITQTFFLDILDWLDILDLHFQNFQNFQNIQII